MKNFIKQPSTWFILIIHIINNKLFPFFSFLFYNNLVLSKAFQLKFLVLTLPFFLFNNLLISFIRFPKLSNFIILFLRSNIYISSIWNWKENWLFNFEKLIEASKLFPRFYLKGTVPNSLIRWNKYIHVITLNMELDIFNLLILIYR